MLGKATSVESIQKLRNTDKCCKRQCFRHLKDLDLLRCRNRFWTMRQANQTEWLVDKLSEAKTSNSLRTACFSIDGGKDACAVLFRKLFHISKNRLYKAHSQFLIGATAPGTKKSRGISETTKSAIHWLEEYATCHGDRMPHNSQVLLAYRTRKYSVYQRYVVEMTAKFKPSLSKAAFYGMWNKSFKHLRIKKVNI